MNYLKTLFISRIPAWLLLALFWLINRFSYPKQLALGRQLGKLIYRLDKRGKATAKINLKLCFPMQSEQERNELIKKNYQSLGMGLIEMGLAWWAKKELLQSLIHFQGEEHIHAARARGKGVILLGAHFAPIQLMGTLVSPHYPTEAIYRPHKKAWLNYLLENFTYRAFAEIIARDNLRGMLRALKANKIIWLATDIDVGRQSHVMAPFFGTLAATTQATAVLAKLSGAAVVPSSYFRRADGQGYDFSFYPMLENFPTEDAVQDAARTNALVEEQIRQHPDQYIWQYKRFKTRPFGEKRFYS